MTDVAQIPTPLNQVTRLADRFIELAQNDPEFGGCPIQVFVMACLDAGTRAFMGACQINVVEALESLREVIDEISTVEKARFRLAAECTVYVSPASGDHYGAARCTRCGRVFLEHQ